MSFVIPFILSPKDSFFIVSSLLILLFNPLHLFQNVICKKPFVVIRKSSGSRKLLFPYAESVNIIADVNIECDSKKKVGDIFYLISPTFTSISQVCNL